MHVDSKNIVRFKWETLYIINIFLDVYAIKGGGWRTPGVNVFPIRLLYRDMSKKKAILIVHSRSKVPMHF